MVERLRGFRDFYPEDQEIRREMFRKMDETCKEFGFREIDAPSVENIELFSHKSGEELMKQMFSFKDKGGREVALIPEFTPTLARMVSTRKDLVKPLKWYSIEKFWRYEEPQAGRFREFYQLNADIVGSNSTIADAEVTMLAAAIMKKLGIGNKVKIKINSRTLMDRLIEQFKPGKKTDVYYVLDRWNKMNGSERKEFMEQKELKEDILVSFSNGSILSEFEDDESYKLDQVLDYFNSSTSMAIEKDLKIVRGIDYYTGYVFEFSDIKEKFRSLLGGGRYDNIIEQMGGDPTPAVGFAIGDAVLENILKLNGKWKVPNNRQIFLANIDNSGKKYGIEVATSLRQDGYSVDINVMDRGISKQLDYASKQGYEFVLIVGENELKKRTVTVKNLSSGSQKEVKMEELRDVLGNRSRLA